jgi:hypothetical protein
VPLSGWASDAAQVKLDLDAEPKEGAALAGHAALSLGKSIPVALRSGSSALGAYAQRRASTRRIPSQAAGASYLWACIESTWQAPIGKAGGWATAQWLIDEAGMGSAPEKVSGPAGEGHARFAFPCATGAGGGGSERCRGRC